MASVFFGGSIMTGGLSPLGSMPGAPGRYENTVQTSVDLVELGPNAFNPRMPGHEMTPFENQIYQTSTNPVVVEVAEVVQDVVDAIDDVFNGVKDAGKSFFDFLDKIWDALNSLVSHPWAIVGIGAIAIVGGIVVLRVIS